MEALTLLTKAYISMCGISYMDVYGKLLDDLVLVQTNKLIEEWFGLKIY